MDKDNKKTIEHVWTILCSSNTIDKDTNNISLYNVIEQLRIDVPEKELKENKIINVLGSFKLVTLWKRASLSDFKEREIGIEVSLVDPNGKSLMKMNYETKFHQKNRRVRNIMDIKNMLFSKSGEYYFLINLREESFPHP